jgi:hypothetical protein
MVAMMTCVLFCAILSACGPSTAPLLLELRTADTHAPIANAAVEADSLALGPSLQGSDIVDELLGRRVAFSDRGMTDATGVARLEHIPDRALRITVLATNRPLSTFLHRPSPTVAAGDWFTLAGVPGAKNSIELRLLSP